LIGNAGGAWQIVDTGDFNGDNFDDIVWQSSQGEESIWTMNGGLVQAGQLINTNGIDPLLA
jgi:hypothetical protein